MPLTLTPEQPPAGNSSGESTHGPGALNLLVALLLLVYLAVGWNAREKLQFESGDELTYLALSRSLEAGSYREIYRASAPLHVQYPPGYPAWLGLVRHATSERIDLIPAVNLALVALSFAILFTAARRIAGSWLALAMLLALVLSEAMLWAGGAYYSEALYVLLSTSALAATLTSDHKRWRAAPLAIALALLAFLTRSVGIAVVLAIGAWLWSRRKRPELFTYGVATTLVGGGWFGYTTFARAGQLVRTYGGDFVSGHQRVQSSFASQLVHRVWQNARVYLTEVLPTALSQPTIQGTRIDNVIWLLVNVVCLGAGLKVLWQQWQAAAAYLVLYGGMLLLWPWPINRLFVPVIPLTLLALLLGAWSLARQLSRRRRVLALGTLVALLFFGAVRGAIARVAELRPCDRAKPYARSGCYPPEGQSLIEASEYIRAHAADGDVVLAWRPTTVNFLSGHLTEPAQLVLQAPPGRVGELLRERRIRFALLTAVNPYFEAGAFAQALIGSCRQFRVEARFLPHAILLETAESDEATPNACAALAEYRRDVPGDSRANR